MKKRFLQALTLIIALSSGAFGAKTVKQPQPFRAGFSIAITSINDDRISRARAAGFEYVEVAGIVNYHKKGLSQDEIKANFQKAADLLNKYGMKVWSIHMPFGSEADITVLDPQQNAKVMELNKNIIDLVSIFHPQVILMHPSSNLEAGKRDLHRQMAVKNLIQTRDWAKGIGAILVVENMLHKAVPEGRETHLCSTLEDMKILMKDLPQDVYVAIDVNHADIPQDYIRTFGPRVRSLHISDCDKGGLVDCHFLPGKGTLNFNQIQDALYNSSKYSGVFMYELSEKEFNKDYVTLMNNYKGLYDAYVQSLK